MLEFNVATIHGSTQHTASHDCGSAWCILCNKRNVIECFFVCEIFKRTITEERRVSPKSEVCNGLTKQRPLHAEHDIILPFIYVYVSLCDIVVSYLKECTYRLFLGHVVWASH